jgi:hypothetical protein
MNTPTLGRIVIVRNVLAANDQAPAIITRVWGPRCVNLTIWPDGATQPTCKTSVPLYETQREALDYLDKLPGHTPLVAHWPDRV